MLEGVKHHLETPSLFWDCPVHCVGDDPGWLHRKSRGSSCVSLFIGGGEVNQMCSCQTNQLVFILEVFRTKIQTM